MVLVSRTEIFTAYLRYLLENPYLPSVGVSRRLSSEVSCSNFPLMRQVLRCTVQMSRSGETRTQEARDQTIDRLEAIPVILPSAERISNGFSFRDTCIRSTSLGAVKMLQQVKISFLNITCISIILITSNYYSNVHILCD